MPGLTNTIHSSTISGQIYSRGVEFYPQGYSKNFVHITTNNFQMLKQMSRFDKSFNNPNIKRVIN
jgi:hypothetical protein